MQQSKFLQTPKSGNNQDAICDRVSDEKRKLKNTKGVQSKPMRVLHDNKLTGWKTSVKFVVRTDA